MFSFVCGFIPTDDRDGQEKNEAFGEKVSGWILGTTCIGKEGRKRRKYVRIK